MGGINAEYMGLEYLVVIRMLSNIGIVLIAFGVCHASPISFTKEALKQEIDTDGDFKVAYMTQYIDHFNFKSHGAQTYRQKYLISEKYWKEGSPIFFYTGNEGAIEGFQRASGFLIEHASKFNAMVIFAEHRYYGTSLPFGNASFTGQNIGYLTISQAMSDYAYFIRYLQSKYCKKTCPLIAFGGSYGGELAAYMRFKYPNLVTGSLSASAPLNWLSGNGDRHGFFKSVTEQFGKSSQACVARVRQGFADTKSLAEQGNYAQISKNFRTCKPVTPESLNHLYGWVRNSFTTIAMMNYPYPADLLGPMPGHPVNVACEKALNADNALTGLAEAAGVFYNATALPCFDIFTQYVECADPTGCGLGNDNLAWDYQACTEINLPGGSTNVTDMFPPIPFTEDMRKAYCEKKYGVSPRPEWLSAEFWGVDVASSSNIIFSNGDLDPWGPGGFHEDLSPTLLALQVVGGAHHLDLRGSNPMDPPSVVSIREKEASIIGRWIEEFYQKLYRTRSYPADVL